VARKDQIIAGSSPQLSTEQTANRCPLANTAIQGAQGQLPKKFRAVYTFLGKVLRNQISYNLLIFLMFWWAHQGSNLGPDD
jgi:hypothetical protein